MIEKGDVLERMQWFEDIEPLFKLLSCQKVPPFLKVRFFLTLTPNLLIDLF